MLADTTPILIGVGQVTEKEPDLDKTSSPVDLIEQAVWAAVADAGIAKQSLADVDELVLVRGFRESTRNSPEALAQRIGADKAVRWLTPNGGNAPQYLVNRYSEAIAQGKNQLVLLAGSEAMDNGRRFHKAGIKNQWSEASDSDPEYLFPDREMSTPHEQSQGMWMASHVYPLFENALRHQYGHSIEHHQKVMGELFSRFSGIAAKSPHAWYPVERSAAEIATATESNRYVGWPYTKYMNAMNQINQGAALLLTSVAMARKLGVAENKWIFLHGCADVSEKWNMSDRVNYYSSPAIRVLGQQALSMAEKNIDEINFIDIYSCFPSAVQIARDELGISPGDERDLTVTGGLPFHGGAGNNYVMNSIAAMVEKLRAHPGKYGLVTANGGYLSKHSAGIYSTTPTSGNWQRTDPASYQSEVDSLPNPPYVEKPQGEAIIETYTVMYGRGNVAQKGLVIGRIGDGSDKMAERFIAHVPEDKQLLSMMTKEDYIGRSGTVDSSGDINIFTPGGLSVDH